ncbi:MAG: tetratricopeptide repeat protein [Bacteroidota bacterium]
MGTNFPYSSSKCKSESSFFFRLADLKTYVPLYFIFLFSLTGFAQKEKIVLRDGNESYYGGKPMEAANYYKKSLKEKQDYYKANFNLGDAYYKTAELIKTGKIKTPNPKMTPDSAANLVYDQASQQFEVVAKSVSNADTIQKAWHNYGNSKLMQKSYEDAILGYKKSLKLNPKDEDTRYNLAYAQKKLAEQQKNQKKDDKKDQDKKDQKEDQKDKKEQKEQEKKEAAQPQMSKEQAEKMLNALKNDEKKMQALRKKKGDPGQKVKVEKDW